MRHLVGYVLGCILVILTFGFREGEPQIGDLTNLLVPDQLVLFSPVQSSKELLAPEMPLLCWGAVQPRRKTHVPLSQ